MWGGYLNDNFDDLDDLLYQAINWNTQSKGGTYNIVSGDNKSVILADATTASFILNLPTAVGNTGFTIGIKKVDTTTNTVTIEGAGSETIDGLANIVLSDQYASVLLVSNGTSWSILATNLPYKPNRAYSQNSTYTAVNSTIPRDNTIPQITEGQEFMTVTITPSKATSRIRIRFSTYGSTQAAAEFIIAALFYDANVNAICVRDVYTAGPNQNINNMLEFEHVPAVTTAVTYRVRLGNSGLSGVQVNNNTGATFGGLAYSTLIAEEIPV